MFPEEVFCKSKSIRLRSILLDSGRISYIGMA
jgi:hypothetical protein